ncbi:MAG: hypothetical protein JW981_05205 [Anaerolineae bacterium]|nr:hypothetical protein [Anaerolineae bacterium]
MNKPVYDELVKQVDTLEIEDQLRLAAYILGRARLTVSQIRPAQKWADVCGLFTYPMLGEDAQEWISRTRREGDLLREIKREETE